MVGGRNESIVARRKRSAMSVPSPHTPPKKMILVKDLELDRMYPLPNTKAKIYPKIAGGIGIRVTIVITIKKTMASVMSTL